MTRNLQAREDFAKGDVGCATGHKVSRTTQPGRPLGSFLVTALQDVKAGTNGWFEDQRSTSPTTARRAAVAVASTDPDTPDRSSRRSGSGLTRQRTK
jgi:hypothetical protein